MTGHPRHYEEGYRPAERTALSRHRTGARSSRRKRGLIRRTGIVFPVAVVAAVAVIAVAAGAYAFGPGSGTSGSAAALAAIPNSHAMVVLEAERQQMIAMSAAAGTLTVVTKPKLASPGQVASANPGTAPAGESAGNPAGTAVRPPDPHTAEAIAYNIMGSYGFPPQTYYSCLYNLWARESGWSYDAENPSGAYGIPQALPGVKMSSAGADWATNPATQIRWGLGYIKGQYGNPCSAWAFEQANNYY